ncbi:MAG: sulfite exporter TauE/SafE family protein [Candidatus Micrarchaeota archaeon]
MKELEIFLFSLFSSTLSPILGIGGGLLNVPFLTLYVGTSFAVATTASLLAGFCLSFSASLHNISKGKAYVGKALHLLPPVLIGSFIGPYIHFEEKILYLMFSGLLLLIAYLTLFGSIKIQIKNQISLTFLLFLIGVASGLFGIGGGLLFVPLLMFTQGMGIKESVATSSFMAMFGMIMGFASHALNGDFILSIALPLAIPALFMGYFGAYLMVEKIRKETIKKAFAGFLGLVAISMIMKSISAGVLGGSEPPTA